jgi:hypothetical protein
MLPIFYDNHKVLASEVATSSPEPLEDAQTFIVTLLVSGLHRRTFAWHVIMRYTMQAGTFGDLSPSEALTAIRQ